MESFKSRILSDWEWRFVARLREVPESPLREKLLNLCDELVVFVREPHCPQVQADGVPCGAVDSDCEDCLKLSELLDTLYESLQRP
jgi:hypothetical protein